MTKDTLSDGIATVEAAAGGRRPNLRRHGQKV